MTEVIGDRYALGRTLGAGAVGRVVEAEDRVLHRMVAVKLLRDDIAVDPVVRERFLREARNAARVNHPNIVAVYDTGEDDEHPWIVMELVQGENLAQRLARDGPLDEATAVAITDAVLAALAAAHSDGLVHRDVKPGNIMLLDDGAVKLADFGIAKSLEDSAAGLTATGQITGTPAYLSPEQVNGDTATPASDIYATGVVLYEMLAGSPPYAADDPIAVAVAHTRQPVPDLAAAQPAVSAAVAGAVGVSLAKDPADRFADAAEMRRALAGHGPTDTLVFPAATTAVLTPTPGPLQEIAGTFGRLWRWGLAALTVLALLLVAGVALLAQRDPQAVTQPPPSEHTEAPGATEPPATEAAPDPDDGDVDQADDPKSKDKKGKAKGKGKGKGKGD